MVLVTRVLAFACKIFIYKNMKLLTILNGIPYVNVLHQILYYVQLRVEYGAPFMCLLIHLAMYRYYGGFTIQEFLVTALFACIGILSFQHMK